MQDEDFRFLQSPTTDTPSQAPTTEAEGIVGNDSDVLRNTLRVYGSIFLVLFLLFCYVRRKYPKVYNVRNWVEDHLTPLAKDQHGVFSWMWRLFFVSDSEMMDECGMDALCFTRVLEFGFKIAVFGMLNAVWLIPVYRTADESSETEQVVDPIERLSISNVPSGSNRFIATALAAWMIFGYVMYNLLMELDWFIQQRHRFLTLPLARNYAVYVQVIPQEYLSDDRLAHFFGQAVAQDSVRSAHVARKIPQLQALVAQRTALVASLEHTINLEDIKGVKPVQRSLINPTAPPRNACEAQYEELYKLNKEIVQAIDQIQELQRTKASLIPAGMPPTMEDDMDDEEDDAAAAASLLPPSLQAVGTADTQGVLMQDDPSAMTTEDKEKDESQSSSSAMDSFKQAFSSVVPTEQMKSAASMAGKLLEAPPDGQPLTAAFVTFNYLRATQAALQMIHYPQPFVMEVLEAPQPEDIFWSNVGKTHKELQLGKLASFSLTTALCLLWTIPMITINTLSSIEGLRAEVSWIDTLLDRQPWLEPVLAQLAPLLIIVANAVLLIILEFLSMLEGPVSGAVVQASLFVKMAAFMIIQTFFVSAISGGIISALSDIIQDPTSIVDLLANSLPGQSTFYIQILLVDTFLGMGLELLRVVPVAIASIRGCVGPNLTEKERNTTWMGLRPLADPLEFEHADLLSGSVLYFMVFFVYATIAPITCLFLALCFLLMGAAYRHQFVYIYPTKPDSGGKLWTKFIGMVPTMMLIAEFTIFGLLGLKLSIVGTALMIPLIIVTILFNIYIGQKHFEMTQFLPSSLAVQNDLKHSAEGSTIDFSFLDNAYVQPELTEREVLPENTTVDREIAQGGDVYGTPEPSVVGKEDAAVLAAEEADVVVAGSVNVSEQKQAAETVSILASIFQSSSNNDKKTDEEAKETPLP